MKKYFPLIILFVLIFSIPLSVPTETQAAQDVSKNFRAFWVSSAYNMDFPTKNNFTPAEMKKEIDKLIARAAELNFNALVVQVRPSGDALYQSSIYPWSVNLTGTQGKAPADNFDPFAYWVERGHAAGLEVHAWINPYRITYPNETKPDLSKLAADNPARKNPSMVVEYKDSQGRWGHYYDPGLPESRQLVASGVEEILYKYMVDGIHLDDYFYPGTDFPDDASYQKYAGGMNRDDWRRENVNALVRLLQTTVRQKAPGVRFGISPMAIWQNKSSTELGSDTRGFETYKSSYADTRRWVKEGWVDYICPQVYWYIGYDIADYAKVLAWWEDVCAGTNVDLYIGHAAYRQEDKEPGWSAGEMKRQLALNSQRGIVKGDIFFRAGKLFGATGEELKSYYANAPKNETATSIIAPTGSSPVGVPAASAAPAASYPPPTPTYPPSAPSPTSPPAQAYTPVAAFPVTPSVIMNKLTVAQPSSNASVTVAGYQILGTCVPGKPVFVNGTQVTEVTPEGFFSYYVKLAKGDNTVAVTQDGQQTVTRVITLKDAAVSTPPVMNTVGVTNAYPNTDELGSAGDTVTLKCTAPAEAVVTVRINGKLISLSQTNNAIKNGASVYSASYSGTFTLPASSQSASIADLGKPVYEAAFNGKTYSQTAQASVKVIGSDAPLYGTVTENHTWAYPKATDSGGSSWDLIKGQKDRVTAVTGNGGWVRFASGGWVRSDEIQYGMESLYIPDALSNGKFTKTVNEEILTWKSGYFAATTMDFDGSELTVRLGMQKNIPPHNLDTNASIFSAARSGWDGGAPCYLFTLKPGASLEGYYTDYSGGELRLHLKTKKTLATGGQPLNGFNIMLDAGHGDGDSGALGPMGADMAEKDINLANALKMAARLRQMGASVTLVRDTDVFYELYERTEMSKKALPDLFISVHANAMDKTTDSTNIQGLTMWYRNEASRPLAETFLQTLHSINPGTNRGTEVNQANFFVCRPAWVPSVIIETSFMCNVDDFSWLVNPARQDELAWAAVNAVLAYYR